MSSAELRRPVPGPILRARGFTSLRASHRAILTAGVTRDHDGVRFDTSADRPARDPRLAPPVGRGGAVNERREKMQICFSLDPANKGEYPCDQSLNQTTPFRSHAGTWRPMRTLTAGIPGLDGSDDIGPPM